jgi:glycosyltransferase involved in cell wall biosynthesis
MELEPFLQADKHRARVRNELGYKPDDVVVGKIARLFRLKGHDDVIFAARQLCRRYPQLRFLLVGDGILRRSLERQIAAAELADRFQFVGLVLPERIPELLAATDMIVHTSLREGLARILPQALLAGRPVISYDVDGAREVVHNGETGFLIPASDVDMLCRRICELASSSQLRRRLAAEGRDFCAKRFDHRSTTRQIRELYLRARTES